MWVMSDPVLDARGSSSVALMPSNPTHPRQEDLVRHVFLGVIADTTTRNTVLRSVALGVVPPVDPVVEKLPAMNTTALFLLRRHSTILTRLLRQSEEARFR
jgi:hypothetical protein